jgi:hypothetical protein
MKKTLLSLIAILTVYYSNAQNTPWSTTGSIGIGTTSPFYQFQVGGNIWNNLGSNYLFAVAGDAVIGNATTGSQPRLYIVEGTHGTGTTIQKFNGYTSISDGQGIINLNGSIGIGTTTPTAPLNVQGGSITTGLANIATTLTTRFNTANPPVTLGIGYVSSDNPFLQAFNSTNSTANNLILNPFGGNVLIGQATSRAAGTGYMLDVAGIVRANAITVNTTGADFVFAHSYKLLTLPELNNFIQKNHHLPEIASAKEMQANGLNLGDNQIKLLQKVEELTLYLIEKDNQVKSQQQEIDNQKSIVGQQSKELKELQEQMDQLRIQLNALIKQQKN